MRVASRMDGRATNTGLECGSIIALGAKADGIVVSLAETRIISH